jgi:hypothetical protein
MFASEPVNGLIYVACRRERGGRLLISTAVPVVPEPEVRVEATAAPRPLQRRQLFHGERVRMRAG